MTRESFEIDVEYLRDFVENHDYGVECYTRIMAEYDRLKASAGEISGIDNCEGAMTRDDLFEALLQLKCEDRGGKWDIAGSNGEYLNPFHVIMAEFDRMRTVYEAAMVYTRTYDGVCNADGPKLHDIRDALTAVRTTCRAAMKATR